MLKKILIFTSLKVVELLGIVFIPYYLGKALIQWEGFINMLDISSIPAWWIGLIGLTIIALLGAIFGCFISINLTLAKEISERI